MTFLYMINRNFNLLKVELARTIKILASCDVAIYNASSHVGKNKNVVYKSKVNRCKSNRINE